MGKPDSRPRWANVMIVGDSSRENHGKINVGDTFRSEHEAVAEVAEGHDSGYRDYVCTIFIHANEDVEAMDLKIDAIEYVKECREEAAAQAREESSAAAGVGKL